MFAFVGFVWNTVPTTIASHWGLHGEANGYSSRAFGLLLTPILSLLLLALIAGMIRVDPMRENIEKFGREVGWFFVLMALFFFYLVSLIVAWNQGIIASFTWYLVPAFVVLYAAIGALIKASEPNWTIGVRTPWTISNPAVWNETKRVGSMLFYIAAIATSVASYVNSETMFGVVVSSALVAGLGTFVYSYIAYRRLLA